LIDHFNVLSSQLTYNIVFYAKILEYSTDNGFLLENISEIKTFFVEEPMYMYYLNRPNVISIIELKSDRIGQVIRRSYIKIQDVATRIGGLSKILAMIVSVISYYYSLVNYELNLADMILKHSSDVHEVNHTLGVQTLQTMNNDISNRKVPKNNFIGSQSTLKVKLDSNVTNSMKTRFHFVITRLICMMDSSNMGKLIKRIREKEFQCLSVNNLIEKMHTLDVMTRLMLKDKAFGTELLEIFYNNLIKRSKEHNGPMPNTNIFNIGKDDLIGFV
jgi:hypothetical protein